MTRVPGLEKGDPGACGQALHQQGGADGLCHFHRAGPRLPLLPVVCDIGARFRGLRDVHPEAPEPCWRVRRTATSVGGLAKVFLLFTGRRAPFLVGPECLSGASEELWRCCTSLGPWHLPSFCGLRFREPGLAGCGFESPAWHAAPAPRRGASLRARERERGSSHSWSPRAAGPSEL